MESVFYFNSAKVFLNFKTPFWAYETNNDVPLIPFNDTQHGVANNDSVKNGAACISDDFLKQVPKEM